MSTYLMFGKYSAEGVKGISANRTKAAADLIKKGGGELEAIYALLGEFARASCPGWRATWEK